MFSMEKPLKGEQVDSIKCFQKMEGVWVALYES